MSSTARLSLLVLMVLPLVGCRHKTSSTITDVTQPQTLILKAPPSGPTNEVSICVRGWTDGAVRFKINDKEWEILDGSFDVTKYQDWYEPSCKLQYTPYGVTQGEIRVEYEAH